MELCRPRPGHGPGDGGRRCLRSHEISQNAVNCRRPLLVRTQGVSRLPSTKLEPGWCGGWAGGGSAWEQSYACKQIGPKGGARGVWRGLGASFISVIGIWPHDCDLSSAQPVEHPMGQGSPAALRRLSLKVSLGIEPRSQPCARTGGPPSHLYTRFLPPCFALAAPGGPWDAAGSRGLSRFAISCPESLKTLPPLAVGPTAVWVWQGGGD